MLSTVLAGVAAAAALTALILLLRRYLNERDELSRVRDLFSRYVPEHVAGELLHKHRDLRRLWAQRHYATVLCCRIRNFGFFAEELGAEETLRHLNEFYAVAGRAIVRHGGVIERLQADGITAVFGVLTSDAAQEERALHAALRIARLSAAMDKRWQAGGRRPFVVTIGVNSGNVVAGEVGFAQRREFAIVGNPAHVASQLQLAAEALNASVVSSCTTFEAVAELFVGVPAPAIPLPGLKRLQNAYIVRGVAQGGQEEALRLPTEISSLETVIEPPAYTAFSEYDDRDPVFPDPPPLSGDYEEPTRSAAAPLPPFPGWPR